MDIDQAMREIRAAVAEAHDFEITWAREVKETDPAGAFRKFERGDGVTITISINGGA